MGTAAKRPTRILLVEDDMVHAKIVRRAVRGLEPKITITHVETGQAALDVIFEETPETDPAKPAIDMILLDLRLPGIDGFEVLKRIKADPRTRTIPVVIVSTSDEPKEINRCYDLGANAYLAKPMGFEAFVIKVRTLASFWLGSAALPRA